MPTQSLGMAPDRPFRRHPSNQDDQFIAVPAGDRVAQTDEEQILPRAAGQLVRNVAQFIHRDGRLELTQGPAVVIEKDRRAPVQPSAAAARVARSQVALPPLPLAFSCSCVTIQPRSLMRKRGWTCATPWWIGSIRTMR